MEHLEKQKKSSKLSTLVASKQSTIIYTFGILLNQFAYAINTRIVGTALVDLAIVYDVRLQLMSYISSVFFVGYILGSLAGWSYEWLNRQVVLSIFMIFHAVSIALFPFLGHFWLLCVTAVFNGLGAGSWDGSCNIWLVEMWPASSATWLQLSQFLYGFGSVVGPLAASSFLYGNTTIVEGNVTRALANVTVSERQHQLTFPFVATGSLQIIAPIVFLVMYYVQPYRRPEPSAAAAGPQEAKVNLRRVSVVSVVTAPSPNQIDPSTVRHRLAKLTLAGLAFAAYVGFEANYFFFSSTMWQKVALMEAPEAAKLSSILSSAYALGRLLTAAISIKVKPDVFVTYHLTILGAAMATLFFGRTSHAVIYAGTAVFGFGLSAIVPGILAFTERHLRLSDKIGSIYTFAAGLVAVSFPLAISGYIERSPLIVFAVSGVFLPTAALAYAASCLFIYFDR